MSKSILILAAVGLFSVVAVADRLSQNDRDDYAKLVGMDIKAYVATMHELVAGRSLLPISESALALEDSLREISISELKNGRPERGKCFFDMLLEVRDANQTWRQYFAVCLNNTDRRECGSYRKQIDIIATRIGSISKNCQE